MRNFSLYCITVTSKCYKGPVAWAIKMHHLGDLLYRLPAALTVYTSPISQKRISLAVFIAYLAVPRRYKTFTRILSVLCGKIIFNSQSPQFSLTTS